MSMVEKMNAVLAENGIENVRAKNDNWSEFEVQGSKPYTVKYSGCADDENVNLWSCSCPAGKHVRECKHLKAVLNAITVLENNEPL